MKPKRLTLARFPEAATTTTLYTVPAGTTTLLKNITVTGSGIGQDGLCLIRLVAAGEDPEAEGLNPVLFTAAAPAYSNFDWEGQHVLNPGDSLVGFGWRCNVLISGVELDMSW